MTKKTKSADWGKLKTLLIASVIILPVLWPLFNDKFFLMHDYTHVTRLVEMERALGEGQFPVRWSRNLGYGYGMPLFNFYGPLIYYVGVLILQLGISHLTTVKLLFGINFLVSFLAMFSFSKYFWGKWGALLSATAFIYVPYRAVDFYVRGALGELTGISFIALSLYCLLKIRVKKSIKWVGLLALSIAGLMLSHNLMALIGFPSLVVIAAALFLTGKIPFKIRVVKAKRIVVAFLLGLGLSVFYWAPALLEKNSTSVDVLINEAGHYSLHYVYLRQFINSPWGYNGSVWGVADELSFEIGKIHLVLVVLSVIGLYLAWRKGKRLTASMLVVSGLIVVSSILLATQKTQFIWEAVPGLNYLQFPWRFLSLIIVFISFMAGGVMLVFVDKFKKYEKSISLVIIAGLVAVNIGYFKPRGYLEDNNLLYYTDSELIQSKMSGVIPDYIHPKVGLAKKTVSPPENRFVLYKDNSETPLEAIIDRGHEFALVVPPGPKGTLRVNIFDYPGWKFFENGNEIDFKFAEDLPVFEIPIEPNKTGKEILISGKLMETPLRQRADAVSVISILILAFILMDKDIILNNKKE